MSIVLNAPYWAKLASEFWPVLAISPEEVEGLEIPNDGQTYQAVRSFTGELGVVPVEYLSNLALDNSDKFRPENPEIAQAIDLVFQALYPEGQYSREQMERDAVGTREEDEGTHSASESRSTSVRSGGSDFEQEYNYSSLDEEVENTEEVEENYEEEEEDEELSQQSLEALKAPRRLAVYSQGHENLMKLYFTTTRWKCLMGAKGGSGLYKFPKELGLLLSLLLNQYVDFSPEYQSANDYRKFKTPVAMVVKFWKALLWMMYYGNPLQAAKIETDYYQQKYQRSVMRPMTEEEWEEKRDEKTYRSYQRYGRTRWSDGDDEEEESTLSSWSDGDDVYDEDCVSEVSTLESHIPEDEDHVVALAHLGYILPDPTVPFTTVDVGENCLWEGEDSLSHVRRSFRRESSNYLSAKMGTATSGFNFEYKWLRTICSAGQADCLHYALERTQYPLEMLWDMEGLTYFLMTTGVLSALARRNGGSIVGLPWKHDKSLAQGLFLFPPGEKVSTGLRIEEKREGEITEALIALGGVLTLEEAFPLCVQLLERGDVKAVDKLFSVVQRTSSGGGSKLGFSLHQKNQLWNVVKSLSPFHYLERLFGGAADDILLPGEPSSEIRWPPQFLISGDWRILWYVLQEYGTKDQRIKSALVSAVDPSTKCTLLELQLVSSSTVSFNRIAILLNAGATLSRSSFKQLFTTSVDKFFGLNALQSSSYSIHSRHQYPSHPNDELFPLLLLTHRHLLDQELLQTLASCATRLRTLKLLELVASLGLEGRPSHLEAITDHWVRARQSSEANEYLRSEAKILIGCGATPSQSIIGKIQRKPESPSLRGFIKTYPRSSARPIVHKSKVVVVLVKERKGAGKSSTLKYYLTDREDNTENFSELNSAPPDSFGRQKRGREDEQQKTTSSRGTTSGAMMKSSPEVIDVDAI